MEEHRGNPLRVIPGGDISVFAESPGQTWEPMLQQLARSLRSPTHQGNLCPGMATQRCAWLILGLGKLSRGCGGPLHKSWDQKIPFLPTA